VGQIVKILPRFKNLKYFLFEFPTSWKQSFCNLHLKEIDGKVLQHQFHSEIETTVIFPVQGDVCNPRKYTQFLTSQKYF